MVTNSVLNQISENIDLSRNLLLSLYDKAIEQHKSISNKKLSFDNQQPYVNNSEGGFAVTEAGGEYVTGMNDDGQIRSRKVKEVDVETLLEIVSILHEEFKLI